VQVAAAAAIPAVLYYFALFVMVDLEAAKRGLRGVPASERPALGPVIRTGWTALVPMAVLVYLLGAVAYSPALASVWAIATIVVIALVRRTMSLRQVVNALATGAIAALEVVLACACVGVIIGMVVLTGIGLKLSTVLLDLSGGHLLALLVLTMIASLVLGTALPTTATYVLLAVLVAPAIVKMGVPAIAAHLFVFYFGVIADITPPTALCVYVASNIAGAPFQRTCWTACRLAVGGFLLPFFFVFGPALVLVGSWPRIATSFVTGTIGIVALAVALQGYLLRPLTWVDRALALAGAVLLIHVGWLTDLAGFACLALLLVRQFTARGRGAADPAAAAATPVGTIDAR
jgi:TRAP transporter 4TM/12TM fusion protein